VLNFQPYPSESRFRNAFYQRFRVNDFMCQPIESPGTGDGIPDAYISSRVHNFKAWIEFKNFRVGILTKVPVPYRPGQFAWLTAWTLMGSTCILALATEYGEAYFGGLMIKKEYEREVLLKRSKPTWKVKDILDTIEGDMQ